MKQNRDIYMYQQLHRNGTENIKDAILPLGNKLGTGKKIQ